MHAKLPAMQTINQSKVTCIADIELPLLQTLFDRYALQLMVIDDDSAPIPGSFWGEPEAGLIGNRLYVRADTPVHSALHEACHYICMDSLRRAHLDANAAGDYAEENAVCYLQILLSDELPPLNKNRLMADMDAWGYSFRLGSAQRWFYEDAQDAYDWLINYKVITPEGVLTWQIRQ